MPKVAVTGATGHVGGAVARALAERGVEQRLVVRSPERAPKLAGSVVRGCSYGDRAAAEEALAGVDTLLMVSASESADRRDQHLTFVDAAAAAGVRQIVYTSFVERGAGRDLHAGPGPLRDRAADRRTAGWRTPSCGTTSTSTSWSRSRGSRGSSPGRRTTGGSAWWPGPTWPGRRPPCCSTRSRTPGSTYTLTGPEALTLTEAAERLTAARGRPFRFHNETLEEAYASRAGYSAPDWQVEAWVTTYTAIAAGQLDVVTDHVERLTGRRPTSLAEHLAGGPAR